MTPPLSSRARKAPSWASTTALALCALGLSRVGHAETPLGKAVGLTEVSSPTRSALTLDQLLQSVEKRYPLMNAAEQARAIADGEHLSAQGGFDVSVRGRALGAPVGYYQNGRLDLIVEKPTQYWGTTFFAGYRLGLGKFAEYDGKLETMSLGEARVGVNVPIWRGGPIDQRRADLWRAELRRRTAEFEIYERRLAIVRAGARAYWSWVAAGKRLLVARHLLEIARARDAGLVELVLRGQIPRIDRDENQRAILQRESQLVAAEQDFERSAVELALYWRNQDGQPMRPSVAEVPLDFPGVVAGIGLPLQRTLEKARRWRPEAARLLVERQRTQIELDLARNARAPGIDFQLAASQDFGDGDRTRSRPELEMAIVLDLPFQTRVAQGRMATARARMARLDAEERFALERIEADVKSALLGLRAAETRASMLRNELRVARLLEEGEREKFRLGTSNLFLVNLREQSTADTAVREIEAQAQYHQAMADFRVATGCARTVCS